MRVSASHQWALSVTLTCALGALGSVACDAGDTSAAPTADTSSFGGQAGSVTTTSGGSAGAASVGGSGGEAGADPLGGAGGGGAAPWQAVVVTFNTGTSVDLDHDADLSDGYGSAQAEVTDQWYGNGLAWLPAVEATRQWLEQLQPDLVVFQEIFHPEDCPSIPEPSRQGYVCESWVPGDPTVVQTVLGAGYQVACNLGKPDKCVAVRTAFGVFQGCGEPLCIDGLAGATIEGCGSGSRIGRAVVELAGGDELTLVNVHGSSGVLPEDQLCRVAQVEQVFLDLDGQPAASGTRNIVAGDFNTDPGRHTLFDLSARRWNDFVGDGEPFHFVTDVGSNAAPTYAGLFNIDHVVSDAFAGSCWAAGVTEGHPDVYAPIYFDHKPMVCTVTMP